ncbi:cytochrome protein, partial [Clohesyomyces aquaticus]
SYRDALQIVLDNSTQLMLIPHKYLIYPWLPQTLRILGKAAADFKSHMTRMLEAETDMMHRGEKGSGSLMTSFVRALDTYQKEDATSAGMKGLSVDEIFGNIFVINFAGHDTTANTLAFSMLLLAAYPDLQDWVGEEVRQVTKGQAIADWDYNTLFPQLKRCRAILLETLRLYPPILSLPKWTTERPQHLQVDDRTINIPPLSGISLATHTYPDYWMDPLPWNPFRWILVGSEGSGITTETLVTPPRGTYYPWSDGPQICLGVKFSQVEFVAVVACLLRGNRLSVVPDGAESSEDIVNRVRSVTEDCNMQMLLRMKHPEKIRLRCRSV